MNTNRQIVAWVDGVLYATRPVIVKVVYVGMMAIASHAHAANTSANHGHHSGGNHGAVGAAAGAFGGGQSSPSSQSGNGGIGDCDVTHYVLCAKGN